MPQPPHVSLHYYCAFATYPTVSTFRSIGGPSHSFLLLSITGRVSSLCGQLCPSGSLRTRLGCGKGPSCFLKSALLPCEFRWLYTFPTDKLRRSIISLFFLLRSHHFPPYIFSSTPLSRIGMNARHYQNRQTSAESAGSDPGLLYRPIRFRGISPAGLYRGAPTERQRARRSPSPTQPPSHPRTSGQGWRSPVTAFAPPKVSTSTTSRSVSVLVDYVPTKLRWRSEEPVHTHGGVLSAARPSTPTLVGSQRLGEPCIQAPSIDPHIVKSPRFSLRSQAPVREYFQPSLRYALLIVETLEVEARAAIVTDESTEFGTMIQRFRHAVAMEVVRVAAFQLFRLERRARASVCEQEFRQRAIIDFWQRDSLQDIQLRNSLEWNRKTGAPAGAPITAGTENSWIPTDSIRHEKTPTSLMSRPDEHSCPVSLRWSKTSSSSRASPPSIRGSAPRDSTQQAVVCDESEIGDATHLLRTRSSGVLYPEVEYTPQLRHQSVDVSLNNGALHPVSTEVRLNEGNMNSLQSLTTTLLQEQRLDAKIARQRASYLTRMDSQLVSQRLARTRDLSDRALQDRLTLLFD